MSEKKTRMETVSMEKNIGKTKLSFYLIAAGLVIGALFAWGFYYLDGEKASLERIAEDRQGVVTSARASAIENWLGGKVERVQSLAANPLFVEFASLVKNSPEGIPVLFGTNEGEDGNLTDIQLRLPTLKNALESIVAASAEIASVTIVNAKCEPYMTTEASMRPLDKEDELLARQVVASGYYRLSPLRFEPFGTGAVLFVPILPPEDELESKPSAVLVVTLKADQMLNESLGLGLLGVQIKRLALVQQIGNESFQEVDNRTPALLTARDFTLTDQHQLSFGIRQSPVLRQSVYSSGAKIKGLDWWVVAETSLDAVTAPMHDTSRVVYTVCVLVSALLLLVIIAVWWRVMGNEQRDLNQNFRSLLAIMGEQKQLLDGINSTISDPISLVDAEGKFVYCNRAFGKAVGRDPNEVIGLDGQAIFGFDTAKRLGQTDQHVLMTGEERAINETLWLQSNRYFFQISKAPLRDSEGGKVVGIVSVYRDITQLIESQLHGRRVVQQTIDALVHAIEEVDPFLGGHSRIMDGMALLIAKQLHLSPVDTSTIEAAASLSQIGKMFVPREILLKPGKLSNEEKALMEKHVEHTCHVLKDVEFELPVIDAIRQMNESLDGSGYPAGLQGDAISIHGRVLAVVNAFAAMARPRSYREALPVSKVLEVLDAATGKVYDKSVVDALRIVIATPQGERIIEEAAKKKAV